VLVDVKKAHTVGRPVREVSSGIGPSGCGKSFQRALRLSFVTKYYERIADQATNFCEMVVYMVEGRVIKHGDPSPPR
jgi:phosphate uptake regulator